MFFTLILYHMTQLLEKYFLGSIQVIALDGLNKGLMNHSTTLNFFSSVWIFLYLCYEICDLDFLRY